MHQPRKQKHKFYYLDRPEPNRLPCSQAMSLGDYISLPNVRYNIRNPESMDKHYLTHYTYTQDWNKLIENSRLLLSAFQLDINNKRPERASSLQARRWEFLPGRHEEAPKHPPVDDFPERFDSGICAVANVEHKGEQEPKQEKTAGQCGVDSKAEEQSASRGQAISRTPLQRGPQRHQQQKRIRDQKDSSPGPTDLRYTRESLTCQLPLD